MNTSISTSQVLDLAEITFGNRSFSRQLPGLQLAIDSTSLGEFKTCPRKYWLGIVRGFQPRSESVHLTFGLLLHQARERYEHARAKGAEHDETLRAVVHWLLASTWNRELGRGWASDHPTKNRKTLVQTVVWYLDELAQDDPLKTVQLASGKPAVELTFGFDSGWRSESTDEIVMLCGHLDRVAQLGDNLYVSDIKTTSSALSPSWFADFSPHNQFSLYSLAARVAFGLPVSGLIVDGIQVGAGFARFQRGPVARSEAQLDEWLADTRFWYGQMERCARDGYWSQNDASCGKYGGCQFRGICSRPPGSRETWLAAEFRPRTWDPLLRRGEI